MKDSTYYGGIQIASDEEIENLENAKHSGRVLSELLQARVTYTGRANPKQKQRNRRKNKVSRKQRRVNRLRSK